MIRNIIKYIGIALVIAGILLVMKNLFSKEFDSSTNKNSYYSATIKLLDKESGNYLEGSKLILKDSNNKVIAEWTTKNNSHILEKLIPGTYTLTQITSPQNYHLNKENVVFEIKNKDKAVTMYNVKMTDEEVKEANTTNTEVNVDNTASSKNILTIITAIITTTIGVYTICRTRKNY